MGLSGAHAPTLERPVVIVLAGGEEARVTLYLASLSSRHAGPETLEEFLNAPARFVAVRYPNGGHALVRRDAVLLVRAAAESRSAVDDLASLPSIDLVHVRLDGGAELDGVLQRVDSAPRTRLSDYFNDAPRFFPLEVSGGLVYVNKDHVIALTL
jgi:hypothetical protein